MFDTPKAVYGLNCAECPAFIATQNNDDALRAKTAEQWNVQFSEHGAHFTPEAVNCVGCRAEGIHIGHCNVCSVRKCAMEKGVE